MIQASLSSDLEANVQRERPAYGSTDAKLGSEAALWLFGLTALTLVFASLLLIGLLVQDVSTDAAVSGAVTAIAVITAFLGLGATAYVLSTAKGAGYLRGEDDEGRSALATSGIAAGLVVAPTVDAGLAAKRRREAEAGRETRTMQARAIRSAGAADLDRQVVRAGAVPVGQPGPGPVPSRGVPATTGTPRPAPPVPPSGRSPTPGRVGHATHASPRPTVRMPGAARHDAHAAPSFLRMSRSTMHPQARATLLQVQATAARPPAGSQPWSVVNAPGRAPVYRPPQQHRTA